MDEPDYVRAFLALDEAEQEAQLQAARTMAAHPSAAYRNHPGAIVAALRTALAKVDRLNDVMAES